MRTYWSLVKKPSCYLAFWSQQASSLLRLLWTTCQKSFLMHMHFNCSFCVIYYRKGIGLVTSNWVVLQWVAHVNLSWVLSRLTYSHNFERIKIHLEFKIHKSHMWGTNWRHSLGNVCLNTARRCFCVLILCWLWSPLYQPGSSSCRSGSL